MAALRIALLGPPRVELDGEPIQVDTRKAIALLAYLAVAPERHGRDVLAELLWPDHDQEHARGALRRTLSTLNKALGAGWLAADRTTAGFGDTGFWLDVELFGRLLESCRGHGHPPDDVCPDCAEPLREATRLHRGDFLAGFALRDSPSFDDWQYLQAEQLRRELAGALARLVRIESDQARWDGAIEAARRWVAVDPLHEDAHRQLMRVSAWSGRRAAALRQYQACVRVLDEELGVAPLEETTAVYQAILDNRLPPPAATVAGTGAVAERPAAAPAPAVLAPLVGRAGEWTAMLAAYDAVDQDGHLVVIQGEAGIGKTRLAEDFAAHVSARGGVVLAGQCYGEEAGVAYGPFVEALRAALPGAGRLAELPAHWLAQVALLLPELTDLYPGLPAPQPAGEPAMRRQFFEGISQALHAACAGPVPGVVFLDDLHWADDATLDVLAYLLHRLRGRPLLVVVTWRSEQVPAGHRLRRLAADALRAGHATDLGLGRLTEAQVAELVLAVAPDQAGAEARLYQRTEGVPFFVLEHLAALPAEGELPGGVRDLLRARVAWVGEAATQLLATAAVIGRSFDLDTARTASGRSDEEVVAAFEELTARGLVREVAGDAYDFGHGLMRELVYQETSLARRRLLHGRVGEALAGRARGRRSPLPPAATIAHHLELGGHLAEAAVHHRLAGDQARAVHANTDALSHYRAALALGHPDPAGLQVDIGDLETLLGNYDTALAAYAAALDAAAPGNQAELEHKLGSLHLRRGAWDAAEHHFALTLRALGSLGAEARRADVTAGRSLAAHRQGHDDDALALAEEALALAERAGDPAALATAHGMLGMLGTHRGDHPTARGHLEQSLTLAETLADPSARIAALNNLAIAHRATGETDQAIRYTAAALELCARQGDRHRQAALLNNLADLLHLAGDRDAAMTHLKQAVAIFAEIGEPGTLEPEIWKLVAW